MEKSIEALAVEIEELKEKVAELEQRMEDEVFSLEAQMDDCVSDVLLAYENAEEFSDLDVIPAYSDENVIILHRNRFRTADLAHACRAHHIAIMYSMLPQLLTPAELLRTIASCQKGDYIFLKTNIFSISDEFERIINDAITEDKVYFAIFTNSIEKIPQSLRDHMRVIE